MKVFRLFRFCILIFLCFCLSINMLFAIGVCTNFARGGLQGVRQWIMHISLEGRLQIVEVSSGVVRVSAPSVEHIYLRFVLSWMVIVILTSACFFAIKSCTRKIRALEARDNSSS